MFKKKYYAHTHTQGETERVKDKDTEKEAVIKQMEQNANYWWILTKGIWKFIVWFLQLFCSGLNLYQNKKFLDNEEELIKHFGECLPLGVERRKISSWRRQGRTSYWCRRATKQTYLTKVSKMCHFVQDSIYSLCTYSKVHRYIRKYFRTKVFLSLQTNGIVTLQIT